MKARPTEYNGIRFSSKAEARLALLLSAHRKNWWYEPKSLRLADGYVPDFMVFDLEFYDSKDDFYNEGTGLTSNFMANLSIIEYKPSRPTAVYIEELSRRFGEIGDRLHEEKTLDLMLSSVANVSFLLLVGGMGYSHPESLLFDWGPQNAPACISKWRDQWGYMFDGMDITRENRRLRGYRFDLETETA